MSGIKVEHHPSAERLQALGVAHWPTWSKEVSVFSWTFGEQETTYILEGEVLVTPDNGGVPISFTQGDLVIFPAGLSCKWHVKQPLRKHYQLG